jgi:polyhydroxybutyrate depolymerase
LGFDSAWKSVRPPRIRRRVGCARAPTRSRRKAGETPINASENASKRIALLLLAAALAGVGFSDRALADAVIEIGGRSVTVRTPAGYHPGTPAPVVMLLHGFGASGQAQANYMQFGALADEFGFLYLYPDGTENELPARFWNATDACCDVYGSGVDDSTYLRAVLDATRSLFNVDERRVFVIGHSNGGFMAYRMACDHADLIAAIASLAGATTANAGDCTPFEPVHALQIHGTLDDTIFHGGGEILGIPYPGAVASVETWAGYSGCHLVGDASPPPLDLDAGLAGDETAVTRYATACSAGGSSELWTIVGGLHVPALSSGFTREVIEFLFAHPKPAVPVPALAPAGRLVLAGLLLLGLGIARAGPPQGGRSEARRSGFRPGIPEDRAFLK